jgi:hypothetical protein
MDVYLVPVVAGRYEPYCEGAGFDDDQHPTDGASWWRRQTARFRTAVAEAEAERRRLDRGEASERRGLGAWVMGRIAESVAEQRLLWRLRNKSAATLHHPDDLDGARAEDLVRASLVADYRKHRNWCGVDGLLAAILGPGLFFVPGPNILGWFFFFRAIGHLFSMRGARQGLDRVRWETRASADLTAIRRIVEADDPDCLAQLDAIGQRLGVEHLAPFVNRVARGRRK